jgi:hypothetical protein
MSDRLLGNCAAITLHASITLRVSRFTLEEAPTLSCHEPDFAMGLIGFGKDIEKSLLDATSLFAFSAVNERTMLRFLKLIACDNGKIGRYASDTARAFDASTVALTLIRLRPTMGAPICS